MKNFTRRAVSFGFAAVALACVAPAASAQDPAAPLKFGTALGYPPFEYLGPDGKMTGFEIDLGNAICAYLKRPCVWDDIDFSGMIPALQARKFDAMLASVAVTDDRKKQVLFTNKVYAGGTRLVARKDAGLALDAKSLTGKRIGVEQGTTNERYAKKRWAPEGVVVVSYADQDTVYNDMINGRLDAALVAGVQVQTGFLATEKGADYAFVGDSLKDPILGDEYSAIAVNKNNESLVSELNGALAVLHADGTYGRLAAKYFPPSLNIYGE